MPNKSNNENYEDYAIKTVRELGETANTRPRVQIQLRDKHSPLFPLLSQ